MDKTLELCANAVQTFLCIWFVTEFFGLKKKNKKMGFFVAWLLVFLEISFINSIIVYDGFLTLLLIITIIIYAWICLKGSVFSHIFITLFSMAIIFTFASMMIFVLSYFSGLNTEALIAEFTIWRFLIISLCRVFEFTAYKLILRINAKYMLTRKEWILFILLPLCTWTAITVMTNATIKAPEIIPYMFYISLIIVAINIIIYYFMFKIKQDANTKRELDLLQMQYNNIKSTEENMKALYESTYSVKHDIEKHLLAIKVMAEEKENSDIDKYIDNILTHKMNASEKIVFTDNDLFNAVMNTRLQICKEKNIITNINIMDDAVNYMKTDDITVLIGNVFDNAIEAAEKSKEKIIVFKVQMQGDYISVYVENSFDRQYSHTDLTTNKNNKGEHGFGTKNIRKIAKENNGLVQWYENNEGMFCCDILFEKR